MQIPLIEERYHKWLDLVVLGPGSYQNGTVEITKTRPSVRIASQKGSLCHIEARLSDSLAEVTRIWRKPTKGCLLNARGVL